MNFNMEDGGNTTGVPLSLYPPPDSNENAGLVLTDKDEAISLCKIASIKIPGATYDDSIEYLPVSSPEPVGCDANCESAIRTWLTYHWR